MPPRTVFDRAVQEEFGSSSRLGIAAERRSPALSPSPGGGGGPAAGPTYLTSPFTQPAAGTGAPAAVASTANLLVGQTVFVPGLGALVVTSIASPTSAVLQNTNPPGNAAAGQAAPSGALVSLAAPSSAAGGRIGRRLYVAQGAPPGGDGGVNAPYPTISAALTYIAGQGVPFWSVQILPGTYAEAVTLPPVDRLQLIGSGYGETIVAPPAGGPAGIQQTAPAGSAISALEIRDLKVQMADAAPGISLDGSAAATYFSGDGLSLLNLLLEGSGGQSPLVLSHVMGSRTTQVTAGSTTLTRCGAVTFAEASLSDVTITGSGSASHLFVNPTQFVAGTTVFSITASGDASGPVQLYIDETVVIFGLLSFTDHPASAALSGAYLEMHGECNQLTIDSNAASGATPGTYDLRHMILNIMGGPLGTVTMSAPDGAFVDARGADFSSAAFALSGTLNLDLGKAHFDSNQLVLGAGPGVSVNRDLVVIPGVVLSAAPAPPHAVDITPPFINGVYTVPQPELSSAAGSLVHVSGKTNIQFGAQATGAGGTYTFTVLRRP